MLVDIETHPTVHFSPGPRSHMKSKRHFYQRRLPNVTYAPNLADRQDFLGNNKRLRNVSDVSYIGLLNYSRAIPLKTFIGTKVGRPRKLPAFKEFTNKKKLKNVSRLTENSNEGETNITRGRNDYKLLHGSAVLSATTVGVALDVIEKRKKSIRSKVMMKRENLLTMEEEQDIHTRADIYAITTVPDTHYYVLPDEDDMPFTMTKQDDVYVDTTYPPSRKKRRRNYGNTNCYVHSHSTDDVFDNTKMLPIGTRLLKPQTKLVELVAQAINGSPDGLLQVQQIYTFLQNRYPFFRYMERVSINSWRSSIRHALYQKWFRKIKFDLSYISSKGCYWSINHKCHPKEWTLPGCEPVIDSDEDVYLDVDETYSGNDGSSSGHTLSHEMYPIGLASLDQGIEVTDDQCVPNTSSDIDTETPDDRVYVPSPVKEPDPILATCGPDWNTDDLYLSSSDSSPRTLSPCSTSQPCLSLETHNLLSVESPGRDIHPHILLGTPFSSPAPITSDMLLAKSDLTSPVPSSSTMTQASQSQSVSLTPSWEEYGASLLSPHRMHTNFVAGRSILNLEPSLPIFDQNVCSDGEDTGGIFLSEQGLSEMINCIEDSMLNNSSDTSYSDIEVIDGFAKSDSQLSQLLSILN